MNYLLYGTKDYLINETISKIIEKYEISEINISRYESLNDSLRKIVEDCQTIPFFGDNKLVIINNCTYFNRVKNNEDDIKLLLDYLTNYSKTTILIIIARSESIDNTKKLTRKIKEVGKIIECNNKSVGTTIKQMFKDYKISSDATDLLISRVGDDIDILAMEIEKLKAYKYDEKQITKEDIINVGTLNVDTDIFKFIDNIVKKNKKEALQTYYELLKSNEEPIKIIALLASKFRLMYQVYTLNRKGLNNNEISNILNVHVYPVKLAIEMSKRYSSNLLLIFLKRLADLDQDIKTGKINPELGLEMFILSV